MKRGGKGDDSSDNRGVRAGWTYLGQFIDHDLTFDVTPLPDAHPDADRIPNFRVPFLDLDHLYGGGPTVSPFLYHRKYQDRGKERFLIGKTIGGTDDDLPRNPEGVALAADPRQDENLIIAQLHVAFLKFHNAVVAELKSFEEARRCVTWTYQYIVLNEFLRLLVNEDVLKSSLANEHRSERFRIPIEFSAAAFRFGHSMVRDSYVYNDAHGGDTGTRPAELVEDLLRLTGTTGGIQTCLPADWVIDWANFFDGVAQIPPNNARLFSTKVAAGLHTLPPELLRLFNLALDPRQEQTKSSKGAPPDATLPLPVRTLWRGARMGLPSGQDVARFLGVAVINDSNFAPPVDPQDQEQIKQFSILEKHGLLNDTPLWYYILKEAQQLENGERLGPVGRHIVCRVIVGSLRADPNSYLSIDPGWTPDHLLPGESDSYMSRMMRLIR